MGPSMPIAVLSGMAFSVVENPREQADKRKIWNIVNVIERNRECEDRWPSDKIPIGFLILKLTIFSSKDLSLKSPGWL